VSKATTLSVLNSASTFLILALQEPWVNPFSLLPPEHQDWYLFTAHEHKPLNFHDRHRTCIYVRRSLGASAINQLSEGGKFLLGLDLILTSDITIRLINVYNTPRSFPALPLLRSWLGSLNNRSIPTIICIDSNLHHPHWNPPGVLSKHPEALTLLETTGKHGFRLVSPKQIPTFYSKSGKGFTLDLTWANYLGSKIIQDISVLENNHGSDHQALGVSFTVRRRAPPLKVIQPNWKKIIPEKARLSTAHLIEQLKSPVSGTVKDQVEKITGVLLKTQLKLSKRVNVEKSKSKGWWDSDVLDPIIDSRNRARKWFILTGSPDSAECYRQWNQYFKSTVASLKRKSWWDFLEKSSDESLFRALRFTKKTGSNGILPLRRTDGSLTTDRAEQAKLLFLGTSVVSAPIDVSDIPVRGNCRAVCFPELTISEVQAGIDRIRPKKAPGIDGIANELLKLFSSDIAPPLTDTFNQALAEGSFPSPWKCAVTAIIRKGGKDNYTDANSYRPIALLSSLGKLFELLIARRLTRWAEENEILADGHLGGRKGAGTEDAMVLLDTWVRYKWSQGKTVASLFLDVKSAYPSVHPRRLIHYLSSLRCPSYLVGIIESFLDGRQTTVRIDDFVSPAFDIKIGLPQGSPLSVILYIIYNNSLLIKDFSLVNDRVSIGYVDDVVHLVAAKDPVDARKTLGKEGERSLEWGRRYGAIFDKKKAQFMWFSRKPLPNFTFALGDQVLTRAESVKWLGIFLDPKLSYSATFDMLIGKLHLTFAQLRPLGNSRWGLCESDRVRLMGTVLLPRLTYGAPVWATKINSAKLRNLAEKADNKAAIYSLGTFKSTPVSWHQGRSAIRPFVEGITLASLSFFLRKKAKISKSRKIQEILLIRGMGGPSWLLPHAPVSRPFLANFDIDKIEEIEIQYSPDGRFSRTKTNFLNFVPSKDEAKSFVEQQVAKNKDIPGTVSIFTDGSYEASRGGAGAAVCLERNVCLSSALGISPFISNYEGEAVGLKLAFEMVKMISEKEKVLEVFIFTDNRGVLERLKYPWGASPGQYIFKDIMNIWLNLDTDICFNFVWCPGHQGIQGNEAADRVADAAARRNAYPDCVLPFSFAKASKFLKNQISITPKKPLTARASLLPIHQSSVLNQLESGHSALHHYLFKSKRRLDPTCPFCPAKETTQHFIDLCPALKAPRRKLVSAAQRLKLKFPANRPHSLLRFPKAHPLLLEFIKSSGRFQHI
jgi:ribonuclease HI